MSTLYVGLDVSDQTTCVCVIDAEGQTVEECEVDTQPAAIANYLKPFRPLLKQVGHEAGSKSAWLHKELVRRKLPVICLDARSVRSALAGQRNKTDRNDARGIAQVLRGGWYTHAFVKSDDAMHIRLLLTHRRTLKRKAVSIEHSLRVSLKAFGAQLQKKGGQLSVRQASRRPDPFISEMSEIMARAYAGLTAEVRALDKMVAAHAKTDPICRRLMTMPGVGPLTALSYRAGVDDPARFSSSRNVAAHFGLTPRRFQSGECDILGPISKMGDESVRTALYEAAFVLLYTSKSECRLRAWGLALKQGKGSRCALVAVARKMAVIMHRMWVTGRDFDSRGDG